MTRSLFVDIFTGTLLVCLLVMFVGCCVAFFVEMWRQR